MLEIGAQIAKQQATEIKRCKPCRSDIALEQKSEGIKCYRVEQQMPEVTVHEAGSD